MICERKKETGQQLNVNVNVIFINYKLKAGSILRSEMVMGRRRLDKHIVLVR